MPRVDEHSDVTRAAQPDAESASDAAAPATNAGSAPAEVATASEPETRAARRARRDATLHEPVLPALATVPRPFAVAATVVLAGLLVLALIADPVLLAAGLAWGGIVVAWGWPALHGSSSRFGSSLAIGVPAVLAPAAGVATTDEPYLRFVPVALIVGLAIMFGHQILRRDGRPRLTDSIGITSFGLAVIALGTTWLPLSRASRATEVAVVAFAAIAAASFADLAAGVEKVRPWMLPIAMLLGGAGAAVASTLSEGPGLAPAALVGFVCAAVSHAVRRVHSVLPGISAVKGQLSSAAASLLVPGVVAYGLSLLIVG
jgi:hypothetical protein